jgi:hypothetical protein
LQIKTPDSVIWDFHLQYNEPNFKSSSGNVIKPEDLQFVPDLPDCGKQDNLPFYYMKKKEYRGQKQKPKCMQIFSLYYCFLFFITTICLEWLQYTIYFLNISGFIWVLKKKSFVEKLIIFSFIDIKISQI